MCNINVGTKSGSEDSSFNNLLLCALFVWEKYMDKKYLDEIYNLAMKAFDCNEVPVGAIVVKDGVIIGKGYNCKDGTQVATKHAEIVAIEEACRCINSWRLDNCELYVTLEPCMMCAGAIMESRIKETKFLLNRTNVCFKPGSFIKIHMIDDKKMCDKYLKLIQKFFVNKRY